jgi:Dolichyl-phosphate-mannose-protein mannosyltransferase
LQLLFHNSQYRLRPPFSRWARISSLISGTKPELLGALFVLLVFFAQGVFFIRANSQTVDEATHLAAGYSYLATRDFRLDPEHPSFIKQLQALPLFLVYRLPFNPSPQQWRDADSYRIGQDFLYQSIISADQMLAWSRFPNLFLGILLVVFIGWWAYRLWGSFAALLATALASFEPNLVAHSSLVTTDLGVALFIFLAVYLLWEYLNLPTWARLAATGISTGMALISKFSALLLIPALGVIISLPIFVGGKPFVLPRKKKPIDPWQKIIQAGALFLIILFCAVLTIPAAYSFRGYNSWSSGLLEFLNIAEDGRPAFFMGRYSTQGWWSYFIVSFLIKTPIGSLMLIVASLVFYRIGKPLTWREATFLLAPVLIIFIATTQAKVNIGIRHILPVYPFLFVLASRLATVRFRHDWLAQFLITLAVLFTAVSAVRAAPHQLAYFNEIVGGPDQGYRYLSDSNLDWGQDLKGLKAYMEKENLPIIYLSYFGTAPPSYYGIRYQYVPGKGNLESRPPSDKVPAAAPRKILAISVYNLQDVSRPDEPLFRWLWVRQPVAKIGYSIFIYDLTHDHEGLMKLEETYVKAGTQPMP